MATPFASIDEFRTAQAEIGRRVLEGSKLGDLGEERHRIGDVIRLVDGLAHAVADFVSRGVATGRTLTHRCDRQSVQGLLDYWAHRLEHAGGPRIDSLLAPLDVGLVIETMPRAEKRLHTRVAELEAQVERMRLVVAAAERMLPDWHDTSGSMSRIDAMNTHCDAIARAVGDYLKAGPGA